MKNRLVKLSAFILSAILFYGCQVDVNSSDTDNSKKASQAQGGAGIQGKAIYSNAEDSSTIQVILDKTDGLLSQTVIDAANGQINISSNVVSPDRTVVSYQCCAADGSYSFSNLEEGTYTVYASSPDSTEKAVYKSVVVKDNEVTIVPEITLTATGALSGKITLDGSENDNAGFIVFAGGTNFMAATAPDGSFTIAGLPAKTIYQIVVMRGAYTYMWKTSVQAEPLGNIDIGELDLLSTQISLTGKDGKDGKDGKNGKDGTNGTNGTPGTKGADGTNGTNGTNGKDGISIIWKGSFEDSSDIANPQYLWAFYNTTDNCSYIYDGQSWTLLAGVTQNASESSNAKVMISYELNGGTLPEGAPQIHTYGKITQLLPPTRDGYYFEGYYLDNNFTGEPVTRLGNDYVIGETLYAKWHLSYPIEYANLDRNGSHQLIDYTHEQIMTLPFENFERNGYVFGGWKYTDEEQTEHIFQADDSLNLLIDYFIIQSGRRKTIVLNAIWTPIVYTITYNCGEATNNPDNPTTYTANNSIQIKDGTYNNYDYGWVIHGTNESCTGWTFEEQFGDIILDIDIAYRITYVLGGGTNNEQNPLKYKENQAVTLYTPTREGYTFTGWYLDVECETSPITGWCEGEKNEHLTIYAGWTNPVIQSILAMTESGTITLTGNYNSDDIDRIRRAMTKLYARAPEIMITLDLTDMKINSNDLIFTDIQNIYGVILPKNISVIPESAFQYCYNLTNVTIQPSSVNTTIKQYAFDCTNIKRIIIPSCVTRIYTNGINSPALSKVYIESTTCYQRVINPNEQQYYNAIWGLNVTIYNGIPIESEEGLVFAKIYDDNIWYLTEYNLSGTNLVLPESFNYDGTTYTEYGIVQDLFKNHSELTSVTIPSSVVYIGESTFAGCTGLTSLTIPNSVTTIGYNAFGGCTGLTNVSLPNNITTINGFQGCTGLTSLTIPNSVTTIGYNAFGECTGLTSLTIPDTVTTVYENAFNGCTGLTNVTIPPHAQFKSVFSDCPNITEVTINGEGTIADESFKDCSNLNKVTICEGVTGIGNYAFNNCTGLETVTFPATMSGGIETSAFAGCTNLSNLTLPETMSGTIGNSAFANCSELTSVIIPQGTSNLGESAFYKCTKLADVNLQGLYGRIDRYAFMYSGLKSITITGNISSIREFAFSDCYNLINVNILRGVQTIKANAFNNCTKLRAIFLPYSITSIGENILNNCSSLKYIEILLDDQRLSQSSRTNFTNYFVPPNAWNCYIYAPNIITGPAHDNIIYIDSHTIKQDGFIFQSDFLIAYIGDETNLTLPDSYTIEDNTITEYGLGSGLFCFDCDITSVTIPSSVNQIGANTFFSSSITSITFNDTNGWSLYNGYNEKVRDISPDELSDPAVAAESLKGANDNHFETYTLKKGSD